MKPLIISAFPGKGKSYIYKNCGLDSKYHISSIDSDSSKYSWIWKDGVRTEIRNGNFVNDYMNHIEEQIRNEALDVIFISSHSDVRKGLRDRKIDYYLVYGYMEDKQDYIDLYRERGNSEKFIENVKKNYDSYIESMDRESFPTKIKLHAREFITPELIQQLLVGYLPEKYKDYTALYRSKHWDVADIEKISKTINIDWDIFSIHANGLSDEVLRKYPLNLRYVQKYQKLSKKQKDYVKRAIQKDKNKK